jgi:hypothetical protein
MIERILRDLSGQLCWNALWDRQTNLWIEFGPPSLYIRQPIASNARSERVRRLLRYRLIVPRGAWRLAVWNARWKLALRDDTPVTGARDSDSRRSAALHCLSGQRFVAARVDEVTGFTRFEFDLGGVLELRRFSANGLDELWSLYRPNDYVLTVRNDGQYKHERATSHGDGRWRRHQNHHDA